MSRFKEILKNIWAKFCVPCFLCLCVSVPTAGLLGQYLDTMQNLQADIWELQMALDHLHDQESEERQEVAR